MHFLTARAAAAIAIATLASNAAVAQAPLSDAARAAIEIQTANGSPVHMGDTLSQVNAALPSAPARPQIDNPVFATLWDQVDGIVLRLSHDKVTSILYDRKSHARIAGLDIGIESPLSDFEKALGPSRQQLAPDSRAWSLDEKRQLVASVNAAGMVVNLGFEFIPKPPPRPSTGIVNWADSPTPTPLALAPTASAGDAGIQRPALTGSSRRDRLNELLRAGDDAGLLMILFPQFQHGPAVPVDAQQADIVWLEAHADQGRASVLYALSWLLVGADRERARSMNARARIEMMLAATQCARPPQQMPLMFMLEGEAVVDVMPLRRESPAWAIAVERALDWDQTLREHVPADWYCGTGNVKPAPDAAAARQAFWQRIRDTNHPKTIATP